MHAICRIWILTAALAGGWLLPPAQAAEPAAEEITQRLYQASELLGRMRACGFMVAHGHLDILRRAVVRDGALSDAAGIDRATRKYFRQGVRGQNRARRGVQCTTLQVRYGRRGLAVALLYREIMDVDTAQAEKAVAMTRPAGRG